MEDILWTAYLAVMLFIIVSAILYTIKRFKALVNTTIGYETYMGILIKSYSLLLTSCIMIAIWYMYFLH